MGYGLTLIAAFFAALIGILSAVPLGEGVTPPEVAFWRTLLATPLFFLHARIRGETFVARKDLVKVALVGVFGLALLYTSFQWSVREGGVALAVALLYTAPALVAVLSRVLFNEHIDLQRGVGIALSFAGVLVMSLGMPWTGKLGWQAIAIGLSSGIVYSGYFLAAKALLSRYTAAALFSLAMPVAALSLLPFFSFQAKSSSAWIALIGLVLLSTYGSYAAQGKALSMLPASRVAAVGTAEPVFACTMAWILLGEKLSLMSALGIAIELVGIACVVIERPTAPAPSDTRDPGLAAPRDPSPPALPDSPQSRSA